MIEHIHKVNSKTFELLIRCDEEHHEEPHVDGGAAICTRGMIFRGKTKDEVLSLAKKRGWELSNANATRCPSCCGLN